MYLDARSAKDGATLRSDVCIAGAGPAGISLANALAEAGLSVDLVESGGFQLDQATQDLYQTENIGYTYPPGTAARLRYFGGTTNHWGGAVHPFDPFELEAHSWVAGSGWPIERQDLDPYYRRAATLLGLTRLHYRFDPDEFGGQKDPQLVARDAGLREVVWRRTQPGPTRMGPKYQRAIGRSRKIRCIHHANLAELVPDESGRRIVRAQTLTLDRRSLELRAGIFVLAAGAIENARLLLLSDSVVPGGLGNAHDQVGRYFGDHAFGMARVLITQPSPTGWYQEQRAAVRRPTPAATPDTIGYTTTPAFREKEKLLGFSALCMAYLPKATSIGSATEHAIAELANARPAAGPDVDSLPRIILFFVAEKAPNPSSRIRLSQERDALGLRRTAVDFQLLDLDWRSLEKSALHLGAAIGRAGRARLQIEDIEGRPWSPGTGGHQCGSTRMADDPRQGVTDRNARVHGTENLYVAGSSLYPTIGWQHPTLTIFALSLRLADHLKATARRT